MTKLHCSICQQLTRHGYVYGEPVCENWKKHQQLLDAQDESNSISNSDTTTHQ